MEILGDIGLGKGKVEFIPSNLERMGKLWLGTFIADVAGGIYLQTGKFFGLIDLGEGIGEGIGDVIGGAGLYASKYGTYLALQYLGFDEDISTGAFLAMVEDVGEGISGRVAKTISDMMMDAFGEGDNNNDGNTQEIDRRRRGTVNPWQYE